MNDLSNQHLRRDGGEAEHRYGDHVHVIAHPVARTLLAELGQPSTRAPRLNQMVARLYDYLLDAILATEFPARTRTFSSRMESHHAGLSLSGEFLDDQTAVAIASIARAGIVPAQRCHQRLAELLEPDGIRIDHLHMSRRVSATGQVVGVDCRGTKIGGTLDDRFLLVPDPMAATGATMGYTLDLYAKEVGGTPRKVILMHLVVTPEYLVSIRKRHPNALIYALRVDRGLSDPDVLQTAPGTDIDRERGTDDRGYIVPGLGGLGELMNNSFV